MEKKLVTLISKASTAPGTNMALLRTKMQEVKASFEEMKSQVSSHSQKKNFTQPTTQSTSHSENVFLCPQVAPWGTGANFDGKKCKAGVAKLNSMGRLLQVSSRCSFSLTDTHAMHMHVLICFAFPSSNQEIEDKVKEKPKHVKPSSKQVDQASTDSMKAGRHDTAQEKLEATLQKFTASLNKASAANHGSSSLSDLAADAAREAAYKQKYEEQLQQVRREAENKVATLSMQPCTYIDPNSYAGDFLTSGAHYSTGAIPPRCPYDKVVGRGKVKGKGRDGRAGEGEG